jgi:guanylate kinase
MDKTEKLVIVGKSGSGKDWLLREVKKSGLKESVKVTTRPKRSREVDGVDYHFRTIEEFDELINKNELLVYQDFCNHKGELWKYGISKSDFDDNQIFIMTPGEIKQIPEYLRENCFIVYLDIDRDIREKRILTREDLNDSVKRRMDSDEIDFKDFKDYDLKISDPDFESELVLNLMF